MMQAWGFVSGQLWYRSTNLFLYQNGVQNLTWYSFKTNQIKDGPFYTFTPTILIDL